MRKLLSILLLVCLSFSLLGYHAVHYFRKREAKAEMRALLKKRRQDKDVVELSFVEQPAELRWENDHEFSYHNEMYDVIDKQVIGDHTVIRCISDKKETSLIKDYQRKQRHQSEESIIRLIMAAFLLPAEISLQPVARIMRRYFKHLSFSLPQVASSVFIPPPAVCWPSNR